MGKKISEEKKKKSVTFTINPDLNDILIKYIKENNINKSKFIESVLEEKLKKN